MPTTLRNTDILFNDGTTQSTAAGAPSTLGAIGTVLTVAYGGTSNALAGTTIAGSSLYVQNTITQYSFFGAAAYTSEGNLSTNNRTEFDYERLFAARYGNGNPGFSLAGTTTFSGTWRVLSPSRAREYGYDGTYNNFSARAGLVLAVRIA